jgi:hypothetical protein
MADYTVTKRADSLTGATRRVTGDRRAIAGTLTQPQNKYVTGGFTVTPASLGFDKEITDLRVDMDPAGTVIPVVERISGSEYKVKLFNKAGEQLASESEAAKEKAFPFSAQGK